MNSQTKSTKKKVNSFLYYFVKITAAIPVLLWMRPKTIYLGKGKRPNAKGMLICSNHKSFTDPVQLNCTFWKRKLHILATTDLFDTKLKNFFFSRMHCIPVDKQNFSMDSIHAVCDIIKNKGTVAIFPEGRVDHEGTTDLFAFKSGVILIASLTNAAILPTYMLPNRKKWQRRITLIGDPIPVKELCGSFPTMQDMEQAGVVLRDKLLDLYTAYCDKQNANKQA